MRLFILFITVMTLSTSYSQEYKYGKLTHNNDTLLYRYLTPKNFDKEKKYPVVLVLHGAGERGNDNEAQLIHGSDLFQQDSVRDEFSSFVIFPQCPAGDYWSSVRQVQLDDGSRIFKFSDDNPPTKAMQMVLALVDSLENSNNTDKNRMYLGGLSMGGMGTFELLFRRPEIFAAAFPICGGGDIEMVESYNPGASYWVFHGKEDQVVPYQHSKKMVEAMKAEGLDVKFTLYPGVKHNSWDNAFSEPDLLPWLFSKELNRN